VHVMCKTCGCHVYEHREGHEGANMGLNVALFSKAGEWMRDVLGLNDGKEQFNRTGVAGISQTLPGLRRNVEDREADPQYQIRL
jgi:hypothetical protein